MVQVHHDEGVANRIDPESCADTREGIGEALTGERIGQPLSRESTLILGADEQSRATGCGVGGAKGGGRGECESAKHGPGTVPGNRVKGAEAHTEFREDITTRRYTPEVGAVCPNWARTDLCGGREVTRVPTAKVIGAR